jgi:maltooligosyltrehalose trehalohydrolase
MPVTDDRSVRTLSLGATPLGDGRCRFRVWAPAARTVDVHLLAPRDRTVRMEPQPRGYYEATIDGALPGSLYMYRLNEDRERPDPASRLQPQGVHGPSQVAEGTFAWTDAGWRGLPLAEYILYELHVGTFSSDGTFAGVLRDLDALSALGVTAIELMPVAQFPGNRNWGYDGAQLFAPHTAYGGPEGLKQLVAGCHARGLAAVLDVVYNHLGPEGNYLSEFGPYFTDRYHTPWGPAVNFDGPDSDEVRRFFIENALYWMTEFHVDALRLDAVHAIADQSARTFLEELADTVHAQAAQLGRRIHVIAESSQNDPRLLHPHARGGYGLDAQWSDDFHHALHTLLTRERSGYYVDYGTLPDLEKAMAEGFILTGGYSAYRRRRHGASSLDIPSAQFVVCAQNHDQVGNRPKSDRLSQIVAFEALKLAAGTVLLSPYVPLLFMGEEYGETAPFHYFTSHGDRALGQAVWRGRREEFAAFAWQEDIPDPQDEDTFLRCRLNRALRGEGSHRILLEFYAELIRLRKSVPALAALRKETMAVHGWKDDRVLAVERWSGDSRVAVVFNYAAVERSVRAPLPPGRWRAILDSRDDRWRGPGGAFSGEIHSAGEVLLKLGPTSFVLLQQEGSGGEDATPSG